MFVSQMCLDSIFFLPFVYRFINETVQKSLITVILYYLSAIFLFYVKMFLFAK